MIIHGANHLMIFRTLAPTLLLLLSLLLGLARAAEKATTAQPSVAEYEAFGQWLVEQFDAQQFDEIAKRFNAPAYTEIVAENLGLSDKEIFDLSSGIFRSVGKNLETELGAFQSARFLRVQEKDGQRRALLRFTSTEGTANYLAFICTRSEGGLTWINFFNYMAGETAGASARRLLLPVIVDKKKSLLENLTTSESVLVKNFPVIQRVLRLKRQGQQGEALALIQQLPAEVRDEKFILLLQMHLAQVVGDKEHLKALEAIARVFPNDPTMDIILVDADIMKGDYDAALRRITSFEKEIGNDTHLHFLRANVHLMKEDWAAAKRSARAALADEPTMLSAYQILIGVSLKEKKFTEVGDVLTEIETSFPTIDMLNGIQEDDIYADFRKSPAYAEWVAARAKRAAAQPSKVAP